MEEQRFKITVQNAEDEEELIRTLSTLFNTRAGSQPADRDFGISWKCLDEVPEVAENLFYLEAVRKVERYEPRVEITNILYRHEAGKMTAYIYFSGKGRSGS